MKTTTNRRSRHPGGRPPKFMEASRPITVTLPERTLEHLRAIDRDRAKAIVKAADAMTGNRIRPLRQVDVVNVAPNTGILLVPPNKSLPQIPWLRMIEVAPGRYLLTIESGTAIEKVEIALIDLIETAKTSAPDELPLLESIKEKIGVLRRGQKISKAEILFVTTRS